MTELSGQVQVRTQWKGQEQNPFVRGGYSRFNLPVAWDGVVFVEQEQENERSQPFYMTAREGTESVGNDCWSRR